MRDEFKRVLAECSLAMDVMQLQGSPERLKEVLVDARRFATAIELLKQARPPLDAPGKWIDQVKELTK